MVVTDPRAIVAIGIVIVVFCVAFLRSLDVLLDILVKWVGYSIDDAERSSVRKWWRFVGVFGLTMGMIWVATGVGQAVT